MSASTPRTGLKTWDGSDPFLRSDFNDNFRKIDSYPGAYICTSSTRPSWGAAQAGMKIIESDTRRELIWNGSSWREPLTAPPLFIGWLRPWTTFVGGAGGSFVVGSIQINRPGTLFIIVTTEVACYSDMAMTYEVAPQVNGNDCIVGGGTNWQVMPNTSPWGAGYYRSEISAAIGAANVVPGTATYGLRVHAGNLTPIGQIMLPTVRAACILTNYTDS
ncbi:hypothetical protein [Kitasatospora viridis]|uniref:DUF2793 domain-containing protein n=1 Tax=Kitasatospora viridis TaxID=281105 RepID=A0A561S9V5_9ACTN|nr:hypothetical protein [Kitasatospora viridis]TWF71659.1 hypothetical protein FHX73_1830 [Kitasatospora viridis]